MSTNMGISCFDPLKESFKNYSVKDGIQSNEFNTGAFHLAKDGSMLMGGVNGFTRFIPEKIAGSSYKASPQITKIQVEDVLVPEAQFVVSKKIILPFDSNTIAIDFSSLDFTETQNCKYKYILEGYDKKWVFSGTENRVRYPNLPVGSYRFKVIASNSDGVWGDEKLLLEIEIRPPFYQTTWFIWLISLISIGIIAYVGWYISTFNLRKKLRELEKIKAVQHERERISRDMHDDIGSGLSKIAIQSEILKRSLKNPSETEIQVEKISKSAQQLVDNLSEIIWTMNVEQDSFSSLLSYLRSYLIELEEDASFILSIQFPEVQEEIPLSGEFRRNFFLVVKEVFNNIQKYSQASKVSIQIQQVGEFIELSIKDNGVGFEISSARPLGNGLKNIVKRATSFHGKAEVKSAKGEGTQWEIQFKIEA